MFCLVCIHRERELSACGASILHSLLCGTHASCFVVSMMASCFGGARDMNIVRLQKNARAAAAAVTATACFNDHMFPMDADAKSTYVPASKLVEAQVAAVRGVPHPISGASTTYLGCFVRSSRDGPPNTAEAPCVRPPIKVVCALDVSGSMSDILGSPRTVHDLLGGMPTKLEVAQGVIASMLGKCLRRDDEFGLVTFNHEAEVIVPLTRVQDVDMEACTQAIARCSAGGGTSLAAGMKAALTAIGARNADSEASVPYVEHRVVVLTDMRDSSEDAEGVEQLAGIVSSAAAPDEATGCAGIHTSFVGIGVDFKATVADHVSKAPGANYFSVYVQTTRLARSSHAQYAP